MTVAAADLLAGGTATRQAAHARGRGPATPRYPSRLGGVDDGDADAVLDGVGWVVELELGGNGRLRPVGDLVEAHERRVADQLGHVVVDRHCWSPFGWVRRNGLSPRLSPTTEFSLCIFQHVVIDCQGRAHDPGAAATPGHPAYTPKGVC